MTNSPNGCDLCGLPLRFGDHTLNTSEHAYRFCCMGCKQVFRMLMEATDSPDPAAFKETELYNRCLAAGIIPGTENDLARLTDTAAKVKSAEDDTGFRKATHQAATAGTTENTLGLNLTIQDMWCSACAWVIDEALLNIPGVETANCNFSTDHLNCRYDPLRTSPDKIIGAIGRLGYRATTPDEPAIAAEKRRETIRFAVSTFLTMNIMMLSVSLYFGFFTELTEDAIWKLSWPIFIMATMVMFYGGHNIFKRSLVGFASAAGSMETLIAVGSGCAYLFSVYNLISGSIHLYFDTAAMLITLVLLGKIIERAAKDRVQEDLESFFSLRPNKVKLCAPERPAGRYVSADLLREKDIFLVEEDEIVPADGLIIDGSGAMDESSLTGEPLPVTKKAGDRIKSGTRLQKGILRVKAEAVGQNSTLGQMIHIMENALNQKTRLEGKTDRLLRWFVPIILGVGLATAAVLRLIGLPAEEALIRAVTVVVISCPCALGVAIPLARVAGISLAGRIGILVRSFSAFERVTGIKTVVFDKTGTITRGRWQLQRIVSLSGIDAQEALALAAGLEKNSDHFIAAEIRKQAARRQIRPAIISRIKLHTNGISGHSNGKPVRIGSHPFVSDADPDASAAREAVTREFPGASMVALSIHGRLAAIFVFADTLKEDARDTITALQNQGYALVLVSGDGQHSTRFIGQAVGIQEAYGQQSPTDKAKLIKRMQTGKRQVAMVGDGVNDAQALAVADLAVAVHSGSHLGKEVADLTLMRGNPGQLLDFIRLARATNRKVAQNLCFAFLYNVIAIPLAMIGLLTPLVAVCAMLLSSLTVTGNTLLLTKSYQNAFKTRRYALK